MSEKQLNNHIFSDPVLMREFCTHLESRYLEEVYAPTEIASLLDNFESGLVAQLDKITGFNRLIKQFARMQWRNGSHDIAQLRIDHLKSITLPIRILSWQEGKDQQAYFISLTAGSVRPLMPTHVAVWLSIYANKKGISVRLSDNPVWHSLSFQIYYPVKNAEEAQLADTIEFRSTINYMPSKSNNILLSTETFRLACLNLSLFSADRMLNTVAIGHDLGSSRSRVENLVSSSLRQLGVAENQIKSLQATELRQNLVTELSNWLNFRRLNGAVMNAIKYEVDQQQHLTSRYDVFNAITSARHLLPEHMELEKTKLQRLAGAYAQDFAGNYSNVAH